jgi:hypothetical protein
LLAWDAAPGATRLLREASARSPWPRLAPAARLGESAACRLAAGEGRHSALICTLPTTLPSRRNILRWLGRWSRRARNEQTHRGARRNIKSTIIAQESLLVGGQQPQFALRLLQHLRRDQIAGLKPQDELLPNVERRGQSSKRVAAWKLDIATDEAADRAWLETSKAVDVFCREPKPFKTALDAGSNLAVRVQLLLPKAAVYTFRNVGPDTLLRCGQPSDFLGSDEAAPAPGLPVEDTPDPLYRRPCVVGS